MVKFGTSFTVINIDWTSYKTYQASKNLITQYEDSEGIYTIYGYDGPNVYVCRIWKGAVQDGVLQTYSQDQNDSDKADFEAHYKTTANSVIEPKATDGRTQVCTTIVKRTKSFKLRVISFYTSNIASVHNINPITKADYGDVTMTLWKQDGGGAWVTATNVDATMTQVDFDPLYAYEIIGAYADIPASLIGGTTDQWYFGAIGLPDYAGYGLAVDFCSEVNIEAVAQQRIMSDGVATQYLSPTIAGGVNYHTNRLRIYAKHPAGASERFQFYYRHFV